MVIYFIINVLLTISLCMSQEKSIDQNIGAQVQLQPTKIQCLPGTPKSQPHTQNMNATPSTAAPHEECCSSKSKVLKLLPLKVAQMEVEPFKVVKPAYTYKTDPAVTRSEAVFTFFFKGCFPCKMFCTNVFLTILLCMYRCNCNAWK